MEVSEFKTAAWQSKQAAELYHSRTAGAHSLFQLVRHDLFLRYIQKFASPGARILDLGCGSGLLSNALYDLGYQVVACDVSQAMLDQMSANLAGRKIELRLGDGFNVPGRDGEFDVVVSRMFLQHFPEWPLLLKEKARVTRPKGMVLFDFGNREHLELSSPDAKFRQDFPYDSDLSTPAKYYAVASEQEMRRVAEECGLELEAIIPHGLLLNNLHFWESVGSQGVQDFNARMDEFLKDEKARALLLLIEESFVANLPKQASYGNITVLRRKAVDAASNLPLF